MQSMHWQLQKYLTSSDYNWLNVSDDWRGAKNKFVTLIVSEPPKKYIP